MENVDFTNCVLAIRRGAVDGKLGPTKSRNAIRFVTVHRGLIDAISAHLKGRTSGFVFRSRRGTPLRHSNLYKRNWKPTRKLADSPGRRRRDQTFGFHSLRHYSVSYCIRSGIAVRVT